MPAGQDVGRCGLRGAVRPGISGSPSARHPQLLGRTGRDAQPGRSAAGWQSPSGSLLARGGAAAGAAPPARGEGRGGRDELRSPPPSLPRRPRALSARRSSPLPGPPRLGQLGGRGRRAPPASATSGACPGLQEKLRAQPGRGRAGGPA